MKLGPAPCGEPASPYIRGFSFAPTETPQPAVAPPGGAPSFSGRSKFRTSAT
jgi:hypothetical protein